MLKGLMVLLLAVTVTSCSSMSMKSPDEIAAANSVEVLETVDGDTITTYNGNTYATATMDKLTSLCYEAQAKRRTTDAIAIGELEGIQKTMAVMHRDTMQMITGVWGKEECKPGTNEFDATIAYYREQNAFRTTVVQTVTGGIVGVMKWGGIAYVGGKLVDNIGSDEIVGGDKTTFSAGNDQVISESSFSHSKSETVTNTNSAQENTQVTGAGDNSLTEPNNQVNNPGTEGVAAGGEVPEELTEEYCNTLGMTLRDSQGVCITYADKAAIEALAAEE